MNDYVAAVAGVVEEGSRGDAVEVGVGVVGADAEDDRVKFCEVGGGEVGYGEDGRGEVDGGEGFGDGVAGAGEVGDVVAGGELQVYGDDAGGGWGVEVGAGEGAVADGAVAFGVGVVVRGFGGDVEDLRGGECGVGVEQKVYGVGAGGLGLDGPIGGGLDVDVGGGGGIGAEGCGQLGDGLALRKHGGGGKAGDGDGWDETHRLGVMADDCAQLDRGRVTVLAPYDYIYPAGKRPR